MKFNLNFNKLQIIQKLNYYTFSLINNIYFVQLLKIINQKIYLKYKNLTLIILYYFIIKNKIINNFLKLTIKTKKKLKKKFMFYALI